MVANSNPNMMVMAMGRHKVPPPIHNGINPREVVAVVSNMGLKRCWDATMMKSTRPIFFLFILPLLKLVLINKFIFKLLQNIKLHQPYM